MILLLLLVVGVLLCWSLYKGAVYATPCLIGLAAGRFTFATGAGWAGAFIVWAFAALISYCAMRALCTAATNPLARIALAIAFVAPATLVAYNIFADLSAGQIPSELWREALCVFGASMVGLIAFEHLSAPGTQ